MLRKSVALKLEGLNIVGELYLPGEGKGSFPTVCICHGIPTKSPDPNDRGYSLLAERICHHGFTVFIFDFRGTGASGGNFDILGWLKSHTPISGLG